MIIAFADLRLEIDALHIDDPNVLLAPGSVRKAWNDALDRVLGLIDQHAARATAASEAGRDELRRSGKHIGGSVRYGHQLGEDGSTLVENEEETQLVLIARSLRVDRGMSYAAIGRELASRGMLARTGKTLSPTQIRRMVLPAPAPASRGTPRLPKLTKRRKGKVA